MQARLLLEDGTLFSGKSFGADAEMTGEVVFNTGITGYQEVLSDPSYCGQIVTMTYPLIGNYGITRDDFESIRPFVHGFVVRRHEPVPSNWRAEYSVDSLLKEYGIPGISEIDTRMLTRIIRHYGTMKGILTTTNKPVEELKKCSAIRRSLNSATRWQNLYAANVYKSGLQGESFWLTSVQKRNPARTDLPRLRCDGCSA